MYKSYKNSGFTLIEDAIFPELEIEAVLQGVSRVMAGHYNTGLKPWYETDVNNPNKIQRINQIHMADHTLYQLLTDLRLGQLAAKVSGAKQIKIWGSQLYYKPANSRSGGIVGFHRDTEHLPFFAEGMFTAWLPLTDIQTNSGPITYIRGSHQWPKYSQFSGAQIQNMTRQRHDLQSEYATQPWHECGAIIPAGGISFHHQDVLHGSPENTSSQARCVLSLGLLTERARFNPDAEDYGYADILDDEKYCPIIYKESLN